MTDPRAGTARVRRVSRVRCFEGWQERWMHDSATCSCPMHFSIYLPPQAEYGPVPTVYWLSGLTCTDENFVTKAGAQRYAAELGLAIVCPDTSPREVDLQGEHDSWDFGSGAGFYINATREPWARHYRMHDYVVEELPALVEARFPVLAGVRSVSGHSMGGHGALVAALRNPQRYAAVSAFAPICAPSECPWGEKAFSGYLGDDREQWKQWDACELVRAGAAPTLALLIDQGESDDFLQQQLKPHLLEQACAQAAWPLQLRMRAGYDHSYHFIATFIEDHLRFHAEALHR